MSIFKYTVANKEGKQLNGTIETPDESSARNELNNLGFSILELKEDKEIQQEDEGVKFVFEALDKQSRAVTGKIPAKDREEAFRKLTKEYDLTVTAIWDEKSSALEISQAKIEGTKRFREALFQEEETIKNAQKIKSIEEEKEEQLTKEKIENELKKVNEILQEFDNVYQSLIQI